MQRIAIKSFISLCKLHRKTKANSAKRLKIILTLAKSREIGYIVLCKELDFLVDKSICGSSAGIKMWR